MAACLVCMLAVIPPKPLLCQGQINTYDAAIKQVRALSNSPNVRLLRFGSSGSGRLIPAFAISDFSKNFDHKTRIVIVTGQHGDEPNPVHAVLSLCTKLIAGSRPDLLSRCVIIVVPTVNPDGLAASNRYNASGLDINRDWTALKSPEAQYVNRLIHVWKPQLMVDVHEWTGRCAIPQNAIEIPHFASASRESMAISLVTQAGSESGLKLIPCTAFSSKDLFHRRFAEMGYGAYLIETAAGESCAVKDRMYETALVNIIETASARPSVCSQLSPASARFNPTFVPACLLPAKISKPQSPYYPVALLLLAYLMMVWVGRSSSTRPVNWSRRFRKCAIEAQLEANPLTLKHARKPITAKSWIRRRLRSRYKVTPEHPRQG